MRRGGRRSMLRGGNERKNSITVSSSTFDLSSNFPTIALPLLLPPRLQLPLPLFPTRVLASSPLTFHPPLFRLAPCTFTFVHPSFFLTRALPSQYLGNPNPLLFVRPDPRPSKLLSIVFTFNLTAVCLVATSSSIE